MFKYFFFFLLCLSPQLLLFSQSRKISEEKFHQIKATPVVDSREFKFKFKPELEDVHGQHNFHMYNDTLYALPIDTLFFDLPEKYIKLYDSNTCLVKRSAFYKNGSLSYDLISDTTTNNYSYYMTKVKGAFEIEIWTWDFTRIFYHRNGQKREEVKVIENEFVGKRTFYNRRGKKR